MNEWIAEYWWSIYCCTTLVAWKARRYAFVVIVSLDLWYALFLLVVVLAVLQPFSCVASSLLFFLLFFFVSLSTICPVALFTPSKIANCHLRATDVDRANPFDTSVIRVIIRSIRSIQRFFQRLPKFWSFAGRGYCSFPELQRRRPLVVAASRHAIRRNHGRWFAVEADFKWFTHSFF